MKVAIPIFNSRVSPRFDFALKLLVATIEKGKIQERQEHSLVGLNPIRRSALLNELGVDLMICGGISGFSQRFLLGNGIEVVPMVQGEIEEVLELFVKGNLNPAFLTPAQNRRLYCHQGKRGRWRRGKSIKSLLL